MRGERRRTIFRTGDLGRAAKRTARWNGSGRLDAAGLRRWPTGRHARAVERALARASARPRGASCGPLVGWLDAKVWRRGSRATARRPRWSARSNCGRSCASGCRRSWLPTAFAQVERFPVTAGGCLDESRNCRFRPTRSRPAGAPGEGEPYLTIHFQLIDLWQELLNVPRVGIHDDFFALGGNSLVAMRMLYRVEELCGRKLLPATRCSGRRRSRGSPTRSSNATAATVRRRS